MSERLVRIEELSEQLGGISRASIYRHIKALPGFPQPVKIGASTRFRESEVLAFIQDRSKDNHAVSEVEAR